MSNNGSNLKDKFKALFEDKKAQECAVNTVLPWMEEAEEGSVMKIALIVGGYRRADPDAAGSAEAFALYLDGLAEIYNAETGKNIRFEHTFFGDGLTGPENSIFKIKCDIQLLSIDDYRPENHDHVFGFETLEIENKVPQLDGVLDTHRGMPKHKKTFVDIRMHLDATSMIAIYYAQPFLKKDNVKHRLIATALKYGIESDFKSSGRTEKTSEEIKLEDVLDDFFDEDILEKIHSAKTVKSDFWQILMGPQSRYEQRGSFALIGLGFLEKDEYIWKFINDVYHRTDGKFLDTLLRQGSRRVYF